MKLHVLSDLHTEIADFAPPETDADLVILAGDIGVGLAGLAWASRAFPARPVIYVPGNHEYYDHDISLMSALDATRRGNIHVLNDDALEFGGVRFLGATLWTDFNFFGECDAWFAKTRAKAWMPDFAVIRNGERRFTPEDSVGLHLQSRAWLGASLATPFAGPTVVVTHHLPASRSVASQYANDPLNPAFASRLEDLIETYKPALWIHGHTHVPCDYQIFDTRVICNPRGYPGEREASAFRPGLVVEV